MWLLAFLIFPNVFLTSGFVARSFDDYHLTSVVDNDIIGDYSDASPEVRLVKIPDQNPLWVLRLGDKDFDDLKLRIANVEEEEDFDFAVEPLIVRFERRQAARRIRKKQNAEPENPIQENYNKTQIKRLKMDIMKIVNKFTLSTNIEPDSYITDADDENVSSLALYFKSPYTSFVVNLGTNQWHFFITPSPFPDWFYKEHPDVTNDGRERYVNVPDSVHTAFYKVLLHTVQVFLGFPL